MNDILKKFFFSSWQCLVPCLLFSQQPEAPPEPPYVAQAPEVSSWTISVLSPSSGAAEPRKGPQTTVYKSGARRKEVTVYPQGAKSETYFVKGMSFKSGSGLAPGDVFVQSAGTAIDFPELSWVNLENFVEVRRKEGKKYFVYAWAPPVMASDASGQRRQITSARSGQDGGKAIEAWIDASTRLPAFLVLGKFERRYQFAKSTPQNADPSEDISRKVKSYFGETIP